jgi:AcrR family transcriptional regulator
MSTREALMKAAAELMREVGYSDMTTAAVARRAGLSEGTIYRHFPSKEALAEAVFADIWRLFIEYLEAHLPPREQPVERLQAFYPLTVDALGALMPRYGTLAQQEHLHFAARHCGSPAGCQGALPAGPREYVALLAETIRLAQQAGAVRPDVDTSVAAHFFFFGAGQAMEFYGDPHALRPAEERVPRAVFEQLMGLMQRAIMGDLQ